MLERVLVNLGESMGDYTEVEAICIIKEKYCNSWGQTNIHFDLGEGEWKKLDIPIAKEFAKDRRACFIQGQILGDKTIRFHGDLKNYDNTIEFFRDKVLPELCESVPYFSMKFEYWFTPQICEFKDGEWINLKKPLYEGDII